MQGFLYRQRKKAEAKETNDTISNQRVTYKQSGEMVFEGIIGLLSGQEITPDIVMKAHNLKTDEWKVISFTSNAWQSQVKGGDKSRRWRSKI